MDIDTLRSLVAFAETGSFSRASQQVHRTQSAISQQMKKLEQHTGKALFVRVGRNLTLTNEGKLLLSYARQMVRLNDDAMRQLNQANSQRPLILGCPDDYFANIMPNVAQQILDIQPNLQLDIRAHNSHDLRRLLDGSSVDLAILSKKSNKDEGYFLQNDVGVWAYNGNDAQLTQLFNLPELPLLLYDNSCHFHHCAVDGLIQQHQAYRIVSTSNSNSAIVNLVKQGLGITAMAKNSIQDLNIIPHELCPFTLPTLPSVNIELVLPAYPHPSFGRMQVEALIKKHHQS